MQKTKEAATITAAASLAARSIARLEAAAAQVHTAESERRARRLQLVSSEQGLSALIRPDGVTIQIENGAFAVTTE
jgi:hypothetical protein